MKFIIRFVVAACIAWGIIAIASTIDRSFYVYPTPETESAFLANYTPGPVIDRFKAEQISGSNHAGGGSAGRKFATHHSDSRAQFVMASEKMACLADAIKTDIAQKLKDQGAHILEQSDLPSGYKVRYEIGRSRGILVFDPLQIQDRTKIAGKSNFQPTDVGIVLTVRIAETWSKASTESRTDSPTLDIL